MDYIGLDKSLERKLISPVYLFYGEETYLRDKYLRKFMALIPEEVRDFNMDIIDARETDIGNIVNLASTLPFMAEQRTVIIKNAEFFKSRKKSGAEDKADTKNGKADTKNGKVDAKNDKVNPVDEVLLKYLENPPTTTCLIFCSDSVDKKRRTYKTLEKNGQIVEFVPLKGQQLNEWIDRRARNLGKIIEPAGMAGLITSAGNNLWQLNAELEKLSSYTRTEKITAADVGLMVSKTTELSIFELVDAIAERNRASAIKMAREMVFLGEPIIRILFMIARQFRLLLLTKTLLQHGNPEKSLAGLLQAHPFVAQKCAKQARNFSVQELKAAMEKILTADSDIKSGKQEAVLALELLIISLCEKE